MKRSPFEKAPEKTTEIQQAVESKVTENSPEAAKMIDASKDYPTTELKTDAPEVYTDDYLDYLFDRLDAVGLTEKRGTIEDDFIDAIYDSKTKTLADACKELELILELRAQATEYLRAGISINEKDSDIKEGRLELVRNIDQSVNNQELFLGSGLVGKVYSLTSNPGFCVKEIYNEATYAKENSVSQEALRHKGGAHGSRKGKRGYNRNRANAQWKKQLE